MRETWTHDVWRAATHERMRYPAVFTKRGWPSFGGLAGVQTSRIKHQSARFQHEALSFKHLATNGAVLGGSGAYSAYDDILPDDSETWMY